MPVSVSYHAEYDQPARPAINVKLHVAGADLWPSVFRSDSNGYPAIAPDGLIGEYEPLVESAYDSVQSDFWQAASEQAAILGLGEIAQEGRSGGWLVFTDGYDPQDHPDQEHVNAWPEDERTCSGCAERRDWLAAYARMVAWCERELAAIPERVRNLAQQYAMDAAGEDAARRMFATFRRELTLREFRAIEGAAYYTGGM